MRGVWIFLSVLSVVGVARAEERAVEEATEEVVKPHPPVWVDGWASFRFNWRFYGGWSVWGRFREFVLLDPVARASVGRSQAYNARVDYPMVNLGLAYSF